MIFCLIYKCTAITCLIEGCADVNSKGTEEVNKNCLISVPYRKVTSSKIVEILTSNSVGTKLFFLGCNQDNNRGSNFIIKKKICLVLPEKEISNHRN